MTLIEMNKIGVRSMLEQGHLVQTLSPAYSDCDRFSLPIDAPHAQWVAHAIQVGTCKSELDSTRYIDLYLEHSQCGAVWTAVSMESTAQNGSTCFARIDDQSLDGKVYGRVYAPSARFSRVRVDFVGAHEHLVPISALAFIGPKFT